MRDYHLKFTPFSFVSIKEGKVTKKVNEHSTAYIKGIIHQSDADEYLGLSTSDEHLPFTVSAVSGDDEECIVFQGVVTNMEMAHKGGVVTMIVEAKSGSYLMDINEHYRTFQNPGVSHSEVLDLLGQPYADYNYILRTEDIEAAEKKDYQGEAGSLSNLQAHDIPSEAFNSAKTETFGSDKNLVKNNLIQNAAVNAKLVEAAGLKPVNSGDTLVSLQKLDMAPEANNITKANTNQTLKSYGMSHLKMDSSLSARVLQNAGLKPKDQGNTLEGIQAFDRASETIGHAKAETLGSNKNLVYSGDMKNALLEKLKLRPTDQSNSLDNLQEFNMMPDSINYADAGSKLGSIAELSAVYQDIPIGQFTVQYYETDWTFAKRLASRLNTFLVPADTHPGIRYYFGMPHTESHILDDSVDYRIVKDYAANDDKIRQGLEGVSQVDAICYIVEQRELYAVGDLVQFQNMTLYIDQIVTSYLGHELVHTYYLRPQSGLRVATKYNERLIGASLDAQVLAVQRDEVQVQVIGDENTDQTIVQWFPFATVYSSPDGTGWYCMPEIGDMARLYMPNNEEKQAVVFNAVHEASGARSNPDIKSMRNKYGKEIRFTPNSLIMSNNAGMEISIIDDEGIRIESDKAIYIKADGDISMTSGAGLSMLAADSVVVQQGGTSLVIDDDIAFVGGKLRMQ